MQIGGEYVQYDMTSYSQGINSQAFSDYWAEKPIRYAAFIQDRLDIGDVVLQVGLRYDRFDTRASRWSGFPRISTNPALDTLPAGTDPASLYVPDQAWDYLSPRVQVSFPVTERTNFRLSYAQSVQSPDFALVLSGINTDFSVTNSNSVYGQNVDYGKSIIFEFGVQHAFSDDMVLDISAYNRDNLANAAGRLVSSIDPLTGNAQDLRLITNADFGNTKGIDLRLNRRFGQLFNGTLGYSYTSAEQHRLGPVHLHQLRVARRERRERWQPAAPAGHRADRAVSGRTTWSAALPSRSRMAGTRARRWARSCRTSRSSWPSGSPAARPTPAARRRRATSRCSATASAARARSRAA